MQVGLRIEPLEPPGESGPTKMATRLLTEAIRKAANLYGTDDYKQYQRNCMALDVSWRKPAELWEEVGDSLSLANSQRNRYPVSAESRSGLLSDVPAQCPPFQACFHVGNQ